MIIFTTENILENINLSLRERNPQIKVHIILIYNPKDRDKKKLGVNRFALFNMSILERKLIFRTYLDSEMTQTLLLLQHS